MIDEPLIVPLTPPEAVLRLAQVRGALAGNNQPNDLETVERNLLNAIATGEQSTVQSALQRAQQSLLMVYSGAQHNAPLLQTLGFPSKEQIEDPFALAAPDPSTVTTTFTLNGKQVLTSLGFQRAAGATAYWLHVVRYWEEDGETQRNEEPVLESPAPLFARVRLPIGKQILRLKSRNPSTWAISDEFTIEVPDLTASS